MYHSAGEPDTTEADVSRRRGKGCVEGYQAVPAAMDGDGAVKEQSVAGWVGCK